MTDPAHQPPAAPPSAGSSAEERLALAVRTAGLGVYDADLLTGHIHCSPELRKLLGVAQDAAAPTPEQLPDFLHPQDAPRLRQRWARLVEPDSDGTLLEEYRVARSDGSVGWVRLQGTVSFELQPEGRRPVRLLAVVTDITQRREAEQELEASERLFRSVVENTRDGINLFDLETGRYAFLSPAQVALTGFTAEEMDGISAEEGFARVHPDDRESSVKQQQRVATGEDVGPIEYRWKVKSGEYRWFSDSRRLMCDEQGHPVALVGVSRDITDARRAQEALLEENQRRAQFLAVLSHELRNPLGPIRNSLAILDRAPAGSEQAKRARFTIERQTDQLTRLVEDLLDATRISENRIRLDRRRLELGPLLRSAMEDHRAMFEDVGVELALELPALPVFVQGDAHRLTQAVGNLLVNAARFTPAKGKAGLELQIDSGTQRALIRVVDTGVGMSPGVLARLFQPFSQADETLNRSKGGLGLGLSLVKGLVELHGGTVAAFSDGPGRGSQLVISLPCDEDGVARSADVVQAAAAGATRRILIIEDNFDMATTLSELLEFDHHQVTVAYNGPDGLKAARETRPDLVFCDIGLPGMDGYEVARAFRADEALNAVFLVALTGYALPSDLRRAQEAGFSRHLAKPPDLDELTRVVALAEQV